MAGVFQESITSGEININIVSGRTKTRVFTGPYEAMEDNLAGIVGDSITIGALHPDDERLKIVDILIIPTNVVDGSTHSKATIKYAKSSSIGDPDGDDFDDREDQPDEGDVGFQSTSMTVSLVTQHPDFDLTTPTPLDVDESLTAYFINLSYDIVYVLDGFSELDWFYLISQSCHVNNRHWGDWAPATWLFAGPDVTRNRKGNTEVVLEFMASFGIDGDVTDLTSKTIRNWNKNQLNNGTDYILYNTTNFDVLLSPSKLGIDLTGIWD